MDWEPTKAWKISTTIIFFVSSATLLYILTKHVPNYDTKSDWYRRAYFRGNNNYNTTWISTANLIWFIWNNMAGFIYVNVSNLNCAGSPFQCLKHRRYSDFFIAIILAPIIFFNTTAVVLRSENDLAKNNGIYRPRKYTFEESYEWNMIWLILYTVHL